MSVSALVSRFSNPGSLTDSPTPTNSTRKRQYSTGSAGSSRSESPASIDSHSPHPDSRITEDSRERLSSITEDKIRMFDSRSKSSEDTDGGAPGIKRGAARQMSYGGRERREGENDGTRVARRQLSAPSLGGKGRPGMFRLPGMASASQVSDDAQEADVDDAIESLQSDDPTLTELNLNNHTRLDPALISQLVEALHGNTHLKTLSLANIRFSEDHAKQLADVLRVNTSLTVLNLESNRITRKGIAVSFHTNTHTHELAIQLNPSNLDTNRTAHELAIQLNPCNLGTNRTAHELAIQLNP
ncbi:Leiomodin-3, partial [Geodia barretti]